MSGLAWSLYKFAALWSAVYGSARKDPLALHVFVKRMEFLADSGFLSRGDMIYAVERAVNTYTFLRAAHTIFDPLITNYVRA